MTIADWCSKRAHLERCDAVLHEVQDQLFRADGSPVPVASAAQGKRSRLRPTIAVAAALTLTGVALSFAMLSPGMVDASTDGARSLASHQLALPVEPFETIRADSSGPQAGGAVAIEVRSGQTLSQIFAEHGISHETMSRILSEKGARERLTKLRAGEEVELVLDAEGELAALQVDGKDGQDVRYLLDGDTIKTEVHTPELQRRLRIASGEITSSLYGAAKRADVSEKAVSTLAKIFSYDIDFAQDLRRGDRFTIAYEELFRDGERVGAGDVIAATFTNRGKRHSAFRHSFADGRSEYFDFDGRSLKKNFLRMPIEFARISSTFGARRHPILGRMRMHNGVDYAAGSGTPIVAAGSGKVAFAGWKGGYGRTVIVDHGQGQSTLYAHMSKFGKYKTGSGVDQGQVIGYVGSTGLATGPHLHYEFRLNGQHRDPLKVTLPKPQPLPTGELARFKLAAAPILSQLDLADERTRVASR